MIVFIATIGKWITSTYKLRYHVTRLEDSHHHAVVQSGLLRCYLKPVWESCHLLDLKTFYTLTIVLSWEIAQSNWRDFLFQKTSWSYFKFKCKHSPVLNATVCFRNFNGIAMCLWRLCPDSFWPQSSLTISHSHQVLRENTFVRGPIIAFGASYDIRKSLFFWYQICNTSSPMQKKFQPSSCTQT